jgi:hypothetical protein
MNVPMFADPVGTLAVEGVRGAARHSKGMTESVRAKCWPGVFALMENTYYLYLRSGYAIEQHVRPYHDRPNTNNQLIVWPAELGIVDQSIANGVNLIQVA